jgi:hypothetical protein
LPFLQENDTRPPHRVIHLHSRRPVLPLDLLVPLESLFAFTMPSGCIATSPLHSQVASHHPSLVGLVPLVPPLFSRVAPPSVIVVVPPGPPCFPSPRLQPFLLAPFFLPSDPKMRFIPSLSESPSCLPRVAEVIGSVVVPYLLLSQYVIFLFASHIFLALPLSPRLAPTPWLPASPRRRCPVLQ